jgi:hypothetical protein
VRFLFLTDFIALFGFCQIFSKLDFITMRG